MPGRDGQEHGNVGHWAKKPEAKFQVTYKYKLLAV